MLPSAATFRTAGATLVSRPGRLRAGQREPSVLTYFLPHGAALAVCGSFGQTEPSTETSKTPGNQNMPNWTDKAQAISAIAVMLLTAVLSFITYKQARLLVRSTQAAEDAVQLAEKTAASQLRAYVGVGGVTTARPTPPWPAVQLILTIKNFGVTPAKAATFRKAMIFQQVVADSNYSVNPGSLAPSQTNITIGPGQSFDFPFDWLLGDEEASNFKAKESAFIIYGAISYADTFSKPQSTEFCFEFKFFDIQGRPCRGHNNAS